MTRQIAIVAGEESGDQLGAALMHALNARGDVAWFGVGGSGMVAEGLEPLFPMHEIAVNGFDAIVRRLPFLLRRIRETADAVVARAPDALIVIDAPEFTHRVAKRVRAVAPAIPIINYVSPTVWAWRAGRARAMRLYVDHVLALFPFEPQVHERLGGPPCTYVGHPLFEAIRQPALSAGERLLVLPGSRRGEVERLMPLFADVLQRLQWPGTVEILAVPHLADAIAQHAKAFARPPVITVGAQHKRAAFSRARAALAASGTVTLELASARIPMVVAYRLDTGYQVVYRLNQVLNVVALPNMVLANIVLGRDAVPAFLDRAATPDAIAKALKPLLAPVSRERAAQNAAFNAFAAAMAVPAPPGEQAADVVEHVLDSQTKEPVHSADHERA